MNKKITKIIEILYSIIDFFLSLKDKRRAKKAQPKLEYYNEMYNKAVEEENIADMLYYSKLISDLLRKL